MLCINMIPNYMDLKLQLPYGNQVKAGRCLLNLTQDQCAKCSGVSLSTLKKYENLNDEELVLQYIRYDKVMLILNYFDSVGVQFVNAEDRIGVYLKISE